MHVFVLVFPETHNRARADITGYVSGNTSVKKTHDWVVDQIPDLFHTTHKVQTQHPGSSMWGHWSDCLPRDFNGQWSYPHDLECPLNETVTDKIHQYRTDYNNRPSNTVSFIPSVASTTGRLHCELVHLLFLQDHRETHRFFAESGFQLA